MITSLNQLYQFRFDKDPYFYFAKAQRDYVHKEDVRVGTDYVRYGTLPNEFKWKNFRADDVETVRHVF